MGAVQGSSDLGDKMEGPMEEAGFHRRAPTGNPMEDVREDLQQQVAGLRQSLDTSGLSAVRDQLNDIETMLKRKQAAETRSKDPNKSMSKAVFKMMVAMMLFVFMCQIVFKALQGRPVM